MAKSNPINELREHKGGRDAWDVGLAGSILTTEFFAEDLVYGPVKLQLQNGQLIYGPSLPTNPTLTVTLGSWLQAQGLDPVVDLLAGGFIMVGESAVPDIENFGDETPGADSFPCASDRAFASKYTALHAGTVTSMFIRTHADGTPGDNLKCAIHADASGTIGTLLGVTAASATNNGNDEWFEVACSIAIPAPGDYWLVAVANNFNPKVAKEAAGPTQMIMANGTYSYASPPSSWPGTDATYDGQLSIYAVLEY